MDHSCHQSWDKRNKTIETIKHSTVEYIKELDEELASVSGYVESENQKIKKEYLKNLTDSECNRGMPLINNGIESKAAVKAV